jgi:hypothetical protein
VAVAVTVLVWLAVGVGVCVGVALGDAVCVGVGVGLGIVVSVAVGVAVTVDVGVGVGGVPVGVAVGSVQGSDTNTLRQPSMSSHSSMVQNLPSSQFCALQKMEQPCSQPGGSQASGKSMAPSPHSGQGVRHPR